MADRKTMSLALNALEDSMYPQKKQFDAIVALKQALAQPKQEEPLPLVDIGVDVTPEGTHVVACYNRPDVVQKMFYSQFHPLTKPEQEPKLSDAGVDTNIPLWGLEPKGSGMVTLNQVGMRVDLKDGTCKEWVGLTDDEIEAMYLSFTLTNNHSEPNRFVRLIEAKLKELNR